MRRLLLCVMLLPVMACYNYLPRQATQLTPAMYVEVGLTKDGSDSLAHALGPDITAVRGRIQSAGDTGFTVSVWAVMNRRGNAYDWRGEKVVVPGYYVRSLGERRSSRLKTLLLSGVFVSSFFIAARAFGSSATGGSGPGGGGGGGGN